MGRDELSSGYDFHERLLNHALQTQNCHREYFLAPRIARIASHTISHLPFFISVFIDNQGRGVRNDRKYDDLPKRRNTTGCRP